MSSTRRAVTTGTVVAALPLRCHTAQPSFEGRWLLETVELSSPDVPKALTRHTLVRANVRGEPIAPFVKDLIVSREYDGRTRDETSQLGTVGGMVRGIGPNGVSAGAREHHAVGWDDGALVRRSGHYTGDGPETGVWDERREAWSIDQAGRLHVVVLTRSSTEPPRTQRLIYRRR